MRCKIHAKKIGTICILLFVLPVFLNRIAYSGESGIFKPKLSIKLTGGLRYINVGDINNHIESFDNYMSSHLSLYEGGKMGKINNYGPDLEGELRLDISSKFAVGVGIGYISGKNESDFQTVGFWPFGMIYAYSPPADLFEFVVESKLETIPIKLGIYYTIPLGSRINIFLKSGLDYYFSKCFIYKYNEIISLDRAVLIPEFYEISNKYDMRGNGLGFNGGLGFEYKISNVLAIVLEIQRRYAKIKNLKGKWIYSNTFTLEQGEDEGILYIGKKNMEDEGFSDNYPDLVVSPSKPSGAKILNAKEATLDLSGFSLRVGIRIKLF